MLKLSKSAKGFLSAQYRSVLNKCFWLNLIVAFHIISPASANNAITDFNGNGTNDVTKAISSLKTQMENTIGTDQHIGTLYVNEKQTNSLYSNDSITYASWIINFNNVYIGYKYENGKPTPALDVEISNRHNTDANIIYFGGGVIVNGGDESSDATLVVNNVKFQNNTASSSDFSNTTSIASGGVIDNFSVKEVEITNNRFLNNYVMSGGDARGGAIYNGTASNQTGAVQQGNMKTENNLFQGNYAGNITSDSKLAENVGTAIAKEASGGALYNTGILNSKNDIFKENFATGESSYGGAIYNGAPTNNTGGTFVLNNTTGEINFVGNYAKSDVAGGSSYGGAIYNAGNFTLSDSTFLENYSDSIKSYGGAIYNTGNFTANNNSFSENYAENGGAIYNSGTFISQNTTFLGNYSVSSYAKGIALYNTGTYTGTNERYEKNYTDGGIGSAIYNNGSITLNGNNVFSDNYISNTDVSHITGGSGIIHNNGRLIINDNASFTGNYVTGIYGKGGVIYNSDTLNISDSSSFLNNYIEASFGALGGAIYNDGTISINNTLFEKNRATDNSYASGGTIYSNGLININNSDFINNETQGVSSYGGAIFNANESVESIIKNSDFIGNSAITTADSSSNNALGGAIYNGDIDISNISILSVIAENEDIEFSNNRVTSKNSSTEKGVYNGGAIFNDANGLMKITANGYNIVFDNNFAKSGGAIYNKANGTLVNINGVSTKAELLLSAQKGDIYFKNNVAGTNGGAINNFDTATITIKNSSIIFENNSAKHGGAIYNDGNLNVTVNDGADLIFNKNIASEKTGGAIYNDVNGNIDISLSNNSKLIFNSVNDDIYNLGTISITGNTTNTISSLQKYGTLNVPESSSQVILNSAIGGEGTYNINNIQLIINENIYIDNVPTLNLENNSVYLNSDTYLNLDANDNIADNSFYISDDAVINYKTDKSGNIDFADIVINEGLIDISDNINSNIFINTLTTDKGLIKIDVDKTNLVADIITINNKIYGKTHILFDDSNLLTLGENERIYFAQTQEEQSLSDYSFSADINGNIYEIGIGNEINNSNRDWFFYRTGAIQPEVMAYIDIPRAGIEQSRSLLFDISRLYKGGCECRTGKCNVRICNFKDVGLKQKVWAKPLYRSGSFDKPVETDFTLYGLDFGYDVQKNLYNQFGFFGSVRNGTYENEGKSEKFYANYGSELDITGILAGAYYRRYFGDFYVSGALYGGLQMIDVKAENNVSSSTDGLNIGAQTEMGYDIRTTKRSVLTPSVKATYDYIKFDDISDDTGKEITFDDVHDIELEAGIKFEYQFNDRHQLPTTGYIKPSVVHIISNGGDVLINDTVFDETLEDGTYWRVEIGADADIIRNFSIGAFGNYTAGSGYDAWMIGGNIRYIW